MKKKYLILTLILFSIFIFRLPSLFEPFWYGDEGIFAAVATNLNQGGVLYQTAWDNKPPLIYLTYAVIFKFLGVSMFWLRLATIVIVLATAAVIYEIGQTIYGEKRAFLATLIFGFLTSLRLIEGNLALTEIFMILPISLAMLLVITRSFDDLSLCAAGVFLAIASLYKQVGGLEAAALGIFLFLVSKNFGQFFKKGLVLTAGFMIPYLIFIVYFAQKNLVGEYIFAAYTYYRIYLGESPKYAFSVNVLKFLPIVAAMFWGIYQKRQKKLSPVNLLFLWTAFAFLGSFFSGRTYGHYLVQAMAPTALLLGVIVQKVNLGRSQVGFSLLFLIPLVILSKILFTDFLTSGPLNQIGYWQNFLEYTFGHKTLDNYNNYFDNNVNNIMALSDFFKTKNARGESVYIWGDYPWLYAIGNLKNPTRYVTSFHVFGVPTGEKEVIDALSKNPPKYIIKAKTSIGYFLEFEKLLSNHYKLIEKVEDSQVFIRSYE